MKPFSFKIIVIIAVAVVYCFYIYSSNNRYLTTKNGSYVYVTDTKSGETFIVRGTKKIKVEEPSEITTKSELTEEELKNKTAIELAKQSSTIGESSLDNDYLIKSNLEDRTDNYEALGWSVEHYSESIAVVGYITKNPTEGTYGGYLFEVNKKEKIVRNIHDNKILEDKYKGTLKNLFRKISSKNEF
jgi:hypothetical protein